MSDSIKIDLYTAVRNALAGLLEGGPASDPLFKFIGHYNEPELENENEFSYRTPAAFIAINSVDWQQTGFDQPSADLSRQQNGLATLTIHIFIHDLRTDSENYIEHLTTINKAYRALIGLRSLPAVEGKFSSLRRIRDIDDSRFENLRHWRQVYSSWVQEPPVTFGKVDAQPVTLKYNIVVNP
jgi:hypothetical protein